MAVLTRLFGYPRPFSGGMGERFGAHVCHGFGNQQTRTTRVRVKRGLIDDERYESDLGARVNIRQRTSLNMRSEQTRSGGTIGSNHQIIGTHRGSFLTIAAAANYHPFIGDGVTIHRNHAAFGNVPHGCGHLLDKLFDQQVHAPRKPGDLRARGCLSAYRGGGGS